MTESRPKLTSKHSDELAARLNAALEVRKMKPVELHRAAGITESYVSLLRNGKGRNPSKLILEAVAAALRVPVQWLVAGDPAEVPPVVEVQSRARWQGDTLGLAGHGADCVGCLLAAELVAVSSAGEVARVLDGLSKRVKKGDRTAAQMADLLLALQSERGIVGANG